MKRETIPMIVILISLILGFVPLFIWSRNDRINYLEQRKQEFVECLEKTNQDFDWCYKFGIMNNY